MRMNCTCSNMACDRCDCLHDSCALLQETEGSEHRHVSSPLVLSLANTQLLNHHDPVHVTSFLRLSDTVRLFRGSAAIRPTFTPCVSCLAIVSGCTLEHFLIRLAFPRTLSFLILFALSFALVFGLSFPRCLSGFLGERNQRPSGHLAP